VTHFDRIRECDKRPDGQTYGHHTTAQAVLMHSIAGQKSANKFRSCELEGHSGTSDKGLLTAQ